MIVRGIRFEPRHASMKPQLQLTRYRRHMVTSITSRLMQRYWRWSRALTLGAQGLVVDQQRRVLLLRHGYRPGWHFPGGGVEFGESVGVTLIRELKEEAGITLLAEPRLLGIYNHHQQFRGDHIALFLVEAWQQPVVPAPNREIAEQGFFTLDRLPTGVTPGTRRRLAEVFEGAARARDW